MNATLLKNIFKNGKNGVIESEVLMAKTILKLVEWHDACVGTWHCNDTSQGFKSAAWWIVPRMLGMELDAFVKMLVEDYHAEVSYYPQNDVLLYQWRNQADMRKYKNRMNAIAREKQFYVGE